MLKRVEFSFPDALRERLAEGRPAQAVLDGWESLEAALLHEPQAVFAALREAAQLDTARGSATVAPRSGLGFAVLGPAGEMIHSDPAFRRWLGEGRDGSAFRRLARLALKDGRASGLVEAADGAVLAACAGTPEASASWPLPDDCREALAGPGRRVALFCFAPSRAGDLAARASEAFGLTPLEARLVEALLDAPSLDAAANRIGVGRETAREALKKAMRKAGARRSPDLVRRMMDLMCGDHPAPLALEAALASSFGATTAEARAAARFARGLTAREVAADLGVKEATVRGQLKAVFAKTGVNKAKDLVRLAAETGALATMTDAGETVLEAVDPGGRLRVVASGERRIALTDYGPRSGRPVIVMHGAATGRRLPPAFVTALQARGYRPLVPQRPGFGLTDMAGGDYLDTASDDMARVLDALRIDRAKLLARDSGTPTALHFGACHPDRVIAGVAVNPKWPTGSITTPTTLVGTVSRALAANPVMIGTFAEMLRRQTRTDMLRAIISHGVAGIERDREALTLPGVMDSLIRDAQGMFARTSAGFAAEHGAFAADWTIPRGVGGQRWILAECAQLALPRVQEVWSALPRVEFRTIPDAGLLMYFSHPVEVAQLVAEA